MVSIGSSAGPGVTIQAQPLHINTVRIPGCILREIYRLQGGNYSVCFKDTHVSLLIKGEGGYVNIAYTFSKCIEAHVSMENQV